MWWILLRKDVNANTWFISLRGFYSKFLYFHFHIFWTSAQFLLEHGHHETDSIMRGKAAVAFHNGNYKELYSIMEGRYISLKKLVFLNCLLCWLFLHFVGWLRRMFGNGYVTSIAIDLLRSFDACYHAELQDMWYKAHYKEAEKIRARPLGEYKVFRWLLNDMWDIYNVRKGSGWKTSCCLLQV